MVYIIFIRYLNKTYVYIFTCIYDICVYTVLFLVQVRVRIFLVHNLAMDSVFTSHLDLAKFCLILSLSSILI